jgi:choline dehydrogenase-like flavoprotein
MTDERGLSADVVIVGGGASGAVVARRLAENLDLAVLLLEAGPSDEGREDIAVMRDWLALLQDEATSVPYPIEPQPPGNSLLSQSRGRVLGGCSSHNAGIALRAPDADLERWAQTVGVEWGPAAAEAAWSRVYETVPVAPTQTRNPLAVAVIEAGMEAGLPLIESWGRDVPRGVGWLPLNVRAGRRQSSSVSYLHPLASLPPNLTVLTDTPVHRVELDDSGAAVAVWTERGRVAARHEVVLCAGAFETPKLLMLSGIGPADELSRHGLPVHLSSPAVGEHLVDHPEAIVTWSASREVSDEGDTFWEVALFADTEFGLSMSHVGMKPVVPAGYPQPTHGLTITPNTTHPRSEGTVRLRSSSPADLPFVDPAYLTDPGDQDLAVLIAGVRFARDVASAPALAAWLSDEVAPGARVSSDSELETYVRDTLATVHHPAGTARMGRQADGDSVVDPQLRVHGVTGLRVADASIFPSLTTVNPCLTCMMVGERAAMIIGDSIQNSAESTAGMSVGGA